MENATKALLIAAAVLIAIVLVALGVNLLLSVGDTTGQAEQVGNALEDSRGSVADKVIGSLTGKTSMSVEDAVDYLTGSWRNYLRGVKKTYADYRFRVYYKTNNESITAMTDTMWENSKVMSKMPSGYQVRGLLKDDENRRMLIVIVPSSI